MISIKAIFNILATLQCTLSLTWPGDRYVDAMDYYEELGENLSGLHLMTREINSLHNTLLGIFNEPSKLYKFHDNGTYWLPFPGIFDLHV